MKKLQICVGETWEKCWKHIGETKERGHRNKGDGSERSGKGSTRCCRDLSTWLGTGQIWLETESLFGREEKFTWNWLRKDQEVGDDKFTDASVSFYRSNVANLAIGNK